MSQGEKEDGRERREVEGEEREGEGQGEGERLSEREGWGEVEGRSGSSPGRGFMQHATATEIFCVCVVT